MAERHEKVFFACDRNLVKISLNPTFAFRTRFERLVDVFPFIVEHCGLEFGDNLSWDNLSWDNLSWGQFVLGTICPQDNLSAGQFVRRTICPQDNLSAGQFDLWTICPGTICPEDNLSLQERPVGYPL